MGVRRREESDGGGKEGFPVAFSGALQAGQSVAKRNAQIVHHTVEWVRYIVHDRITL